MPNITITRIDQTVTLALGAVPRYTPVCVQVAC